MTVAAAERASNLRSQSRARVAQFRAVAGTGLAEGGVALGPVIPSMARDLGAESDYLHFRGVVQAAIRPIANTVAGQDVRIAKLRKPDSSRATARSIRSIRPVNGMETAFWARTNDGREVLLPKHLKASAPDLEIHETHRALDLLEDPNPVMTDWHLLWLTVVNMDLTGRAYWWDTKTSARRTQGGHVVWPLPTSWVVPDHEGGLFSGWKVFPGGGMESKDVPGHEIILYHYPDPSSLLGSRSPVEAQHRAVRTDESIQLAQEALFENGMFPRYAIFAGDPADEEEEDGTPMLPEHMHLLMETAIAQRWVGAQRTGTPILLSALFKKLERISNTVEEMDFLDSGKSTYDRITQGIGSHPYVMGATEPSSRAASAEARRHFGDFTINPRLELISKVMSKKFAPRFSNGRDRLVMWVEPYTPDDREERRADWEVLAKYQSCNRNELRAGLLGLGEIADGDTMAAPPTQVLMPVEPAKSLPTAGLAAAKSPEDRRAQAWLKAHGQHEKRLDVVVTEFFKDQREEVQRRFHKLAGSGLAGVSAEAIVAEVFDSVDWDERLIAAVGPTCESIILDGAMRELSPHRSKQFIEASELSPAVQAAMQAELDTILTQNFSPNINQTTRKALAKTMSEGIAAGESEYEMIVRIGDSPTVPGVTDGVLGSQTTVARSANIYRTECLAGDTPVDGAVLTAAYRRFYRGPMFKVVTESGRELTGSPNHPMLTVRGWVPLCELTESDYLIAHRPNVEPPRPSRDQNVKACPATIGEIFDSLSAVIFSARERSGEPDFHGDGQEGNVDVLRPDGILSIGRFAAVDEFAVDGILTPTDARCLVMAVHSAPFARGLPIDGCHGFWEASHAAAVFQDKSPHGAFGDTVFQADVSNLDTRSVVRNDHQFRQVFGIAAIARGQKCLACGGQRSALDPGTPQRSKYGVGANAQDASHGAIALAGPVYGHGAIGHIRGETLPRSRRFRPRPHDTSLSALTADPVSAGSGFLGNLSATKAGRIEIDRVSNLVCVPNWFGHVYNLTTVHGYFNAAQLYTGNTTGLLNSGHNAQQDELLQQGLIRGKRWTVTDDQYLRPEHRALNGVVAPGPDSPDGLFNVSGYKVPYPGHHSLPPHLRCGCRCTPVSVF